MGIRIRSILELTEEELKDLLPHDEFLLQKNQTTEYNDDGNPTGKTIKKEEQTMEFHNKGKGLPTGRRIDPKEQPWIKELIRNQTTEFDDNCCPTGRTILKEEQTMKFEHRDGTGYAIGERIDPKDQPWNKGKKIRIIKKKSSSDNSLVESKGLDIKEAKKLLSKHYKIPIKNIEIYLKG